VETNRPRRDRRPSSRWRAVLGAPLVHFVLLGGAAFALAPAEPPAIVIDEAAVRAAFAAGEGRPPGPEALRAQVARAVDEEILLREAWASGRLRHDGTVVQRLVQLGRFLGPDGALEPEEAARRARALGLDRSDPVIRRYLVERMRLALASEADHPAPDEPALRAWLARHPERFRLPERLHLRHVFVSARRPEPEARAASLGRTLRGRTPAAAKGLGDPSPRGPQVVASREGLARRFGPAFVAALDDGATGRWQGPVPSAHGLHWVWVEAVEPARTPAFDAVRSRVRQDLLRERRERHLRRRLDALRTGYAVRVEASGRDVEASVGAARQDSRAAVGAGR